MTSAGNTYFLITFSTLKISLAGRGRSNAIKGMAKNFPVRLGRPMGSYERADLPFGDRVCWAIFEQGYNHWIVEITNP